MRSDPKTCEEVQELLMSFIREDDRPIDVFVWVLVVIAALALILR